MKTMKSNPIYSSYTISKDIKRNKITLRIYCYSVLGGWMASHLGWSSLGNSWPVCPSQVTLDQSQVNGILA